MVTTVKLNAEYTAVDKVEEWVFSLPPSFFAIVSGAFIGTATNLLTGLIFDEKVPIDGLLRAIFLIFASAACFCCISIILEQIHIEVSGEDKITRRYNLRGEIYKRRKILWLLFIGGLVSIMVGINQLLCTRLLGK